LAEVVEPALPDDGPETKDPFLPFLAGDRLLQLLPDQVDRLHVIGALSAAKEELGYDHDLQDRRRRPRPRVPLFQYGFYQIDPRRDVAGVALQPDVLVQEQPFFSIPGHARTGIDRPTNKLDIHFGPPPRPLWPAKMLNY